MTKSNSQLDENLQNINLQIDQNLSAIFEDFTKKFEIDKKGLEAKNSKEEFIAALQNIIIKFKHDYNLVLETNSPYLEGDIKNKEILVKISKLLQSTLVEAAIGKVNPKYKITQEDEIYNEISIAKGLAETATQKLYDQYKNYILSYTKLLPQDIKNDNNSIISEISEKFAEITNKRKIDNIEDLLLVNYGKAISCFVKNDYFPSIQNLSLALSDKNSDIEDQFHMIQIFIFEEISNQLKNVEDFYKEIDKQIEIFSKVHNAQTINSQLLVCKLDKLVLEKKYKEAQEVVKTIIDRAYQSSFIFFKITDCLEKVFEQLQIDDPKKYDTEIKQIKNTLVKLYESTLKFHENHIEENTTYLEDNISYITYNLGKYVDVLSERNRHGSAKLAASKLIDFVKKVQEKTPIDITTKIYLCQSYENLINIYLEEPSAQNIEKILPLCQEYKNILISDEEFADLKSENDQVDNIKKEGEILAKKIELISQLCKKYLDSIDHQYNPNLNPFYEDKEKYERLKARKLLEEETNVKNQILNEINSFKKDPQGDFNQFLINSIKIADNFRIIANEESNLRSKINYLSIVDSIEEQILIEYRNLKVETKDNVKKELDNLISNSKETKEQIAKNYIQAIKEINNVEQFLFTAALKITQNYKSGLIGKEYSYIEDFYAALKNLSDSNLETNETNLKKAKIYLNQAPIAERKSAKENLEKCQTEWDKSKKLLLNSQQSLHQLISKNNEFSIASSLLARIYDSLEQTEKSESFTKKALKQNPKNIHAAELNAVSRERKGEVAEAINIYCQILEDNHLPLFEDKLTKVKDLFIEKYKKLLDDLKTINKKQKGNHKKQNETNRTNIEQEINKMEKDLDIINDVNPVARQLKSEIYSKKGQYLLELNDYKKAADCFKKSIEMSPIANFDYGNLAKSYRNINNNKEALRICQNALSNDSKSCLEFATIFLENDMLEEAIKQFKLHLSSKEKELNKINTESELNEFNKLFEQKTAYYSNYLSPEESQDFNDKLKNAFFSKEEADLSFIIVYNNKVFAQKLNNLNDKYEEELRSKNEEFEAKSDIKYNAFFDKFSEVNEEKLNKSNNQKDLLLKESILEKLDNSRNIDLLEYKKHKKQIWDRMAQDSVYGIDSIDESLIKNEEKETIKLYLQSIPNSYLPSNSPSNANAKRSKSATSLSRDI